MNRLLAAVLCAAVMGGCHADQKYSQTELTALQTREYPASYDATYDAAVNALFDAGYIIQSSDKRGGFISGSKASFSGAFGNSAAAVQVKVEGAGNGRTSVRVSTTDGGQQRVYKEQIDEVLGLINRRLLTSEPAAGVKR